MRAKKLEPEQTSLQIYLLVEIAVPALSVLLILAGSLFYTFFCVLLGALLHRRMMSEYRTYAVGAVYIPLAKILDSGIYILTLLASCPYIVLRPGLIYASNQDMPILENLLTAWHEEMVVAVACLVFIIFVTSLNPTDNGLFFQFKAVMLSISLALSISAASGSIAALIHYGRMWPISVVAATLVARLCTKLCDRAGKFISFAIIFFCTMASEIVMENYLFASQDLFSKSVESLSY